MTTLNTDSFYHRQRDLFEGDDDTPMKFQCHPLAVFAYLSDYPPHLHAMNSVESFTADDMGELAGHYLSIGASMEEFYKTELSTTLVSKGVLNNWEIRVRDLLTYVASHTVPTQLWGTATVLPLVYQFDQSELEIIGSCKSLDRQSSQERRLENVQLIKELIPPVTMMVHSDIYTDFDTFYMRTTDNHLLVAKLTTHHTAHTAFKALCDLSAVTLTGKTTIEEHRTGFYFYEMIDPYVSI